VDTFQTKETWRCLLYFAYFYEANFYGVTALANECDRFLGTGYKVDPKALCSTIRQHLHLHEDKIEVDVEENKRDMTIQLALSNLLAPFCCKGVITDGVKAVTLPLWGDSTIDNLNLPELIAKAALSPFGRGSKTIYDPNVRNSLEIPATELNEHSLCSLSYEMNIHELAPSMDLELRPYKLVIYQEDGHFDEHCDTVRGEGHIGTLVLTLNSEYTGGELEITHGNKTVSVTGPYSWVAMYGDCLHKVNPVTSGTRVSLIYDIYGEPTRPKELWEELWDNYYRGVQSKFPASPPHAAQKEVIEELDYELAQYDSVVICLQHLYPVSQTVPGFLKGADHLLYEALKDNYAVQVVHAHLIHTFWDDGEDVTVDIFGLQPNPDDTAGSMKKRKVKFVIPRGLDHDAVLDHSPSTERTGNEGHEGYESYLVAALKVRRKTV
jgi:hypothetical protein